MISGRAGRVASRELEGERMRVRLLALVALAIVAMAPLSALARTTSPVMTASFTGADYVHVDGSGCAGLTYFDLENYYSAVVAADPTIFGFASNDATDAGVSGSYTGTTMGQRIFNVEFWAYSDSDINESYFEWDGYAALKCQADGTMQFSFKPSYDYYYAQYNPDTGYYVEGDLGGQARVTFTLDLANAGAAAAVYAPVTLRQTWAGYETP